MTKRQNSKQKIAFLESEIAAYRQMALDRARERDDAQDEVVNLNCRMAGASTAPADAQLCRRLAETIFADSIVDGSAKAETFSPDDVARRVYELSRDEVQRSDDLRELMDVCGINNTKMMNVTEQIAALKAQVYQWQTTQESYDALPDNYGDWCDWIKLTTFEPIDVDRMTDLLDLLGLSGKHLDYVLQSSDLGAALAKVRS
jgi:hypothetical protein